MVAPHEFDCGCEDGDGWIKVSSKKNLHKCQEQSSVASKIGTVVECRLIIIVPVPSHCAAEPTARCMTVLMGEKW